MKLTEWYPGDVKPVRVGVYQQRDGGLGLTIGYQFWSGKFWSSWAETAESAERGNRFLASDRHQNDPWRGVAK